MNREIKFKAWDSVHNRMIYLKECISFGYSNEFDIYELYVEENNLKCRGYDDFDDDFGDDDDAKMVEEAESSVRTRLSSLEKRRLIDNLLEEKRLAKALKDDLDDLGEDDDDDFDDDWDDDDDI